MRWIANDRGLDQAEGLVGRDEHGVPILHAEAGDVERNVMLVGHDETDGGQLVVRIERRASHRMERVLHRTAVVSANVASRRCRTDRHTPSNGISVRTYRHAAVRDVARMRSAVPRQGGEPVPRKAFEGGRGRLQDHERVDPCVDHD